MNITFLSQVYKPTINGVVISMDNFARGLRRLGHTVYIVANPPEKPYKDDEYTFRWKYALKSKKRAYGIPIPFSKRIRNIFKTSDIIHVQHPIVEIPIGAFQKWFRGKKLVFTYHSMYDEYAKKYIPFGLGKNRGIKNLIVNGVYAFCNACDLVIAPSNGVKRFLEKKVKKPRIEVIPTGIDIDRFKKADGSFLRKKYGISGPLIVYTGRVAKEKNIDMLLEVYKRVYEKHKVTLILAGGADRKLESKLKSVPGIILTGKIPYEDMPGYYKIPGTLFFISASNTETQGITYCEAMAAGLPVIAMRCWGSEDIVNNGIDGYIVDSPDELVEKMVLLIKNEKLREKLAKNATMDIERFSIENMARKMLRAYNSILPSS